MSEPSSTDTSLKLSICGSLSRYRALSQTRGRCWTLFLKSGAVSTAWKSYIVELSVSEVEHNELALLLQRLLMTRGTEPFSALERLLLSEAESSLRRESDTLTQTLLCLTNVLPPDKRPTLLTRATKRLTSFAFRIGA